MTLFILLLLYYYLAPHELAPTLSSCNASSGCVFVLLKDLTQLSPKLCARACPQNSWVFLSRKWLIIWNGSPCVWLCLAISTSIGITWRLLVLWVDFLTINAQVGAGHPHTQLFIFVSADPLTAGTSTFSKADMTVRLPWNAGTFKCVQGQFDRWHFAQWYSCFCNQCLLEDTSASINVWEIIIIMIKNKAV